MANTIKIKNSGVAANVPASLEHGELAINYADGKIFYKDGANVVVEFSSATVSNINSLSDVVITDPAEFQTLEYNGTNWVNSYSSNVTFARNDEANTLTTGTIVYVSGSTGDHAKVKRADNDSDTTSATILGVVGANILSSENGPVVTLGYVDGLDLSIGYSAGDIIWLGENGGFTTTKPVAPEHLVFIGIVVRATNNGIIFVAPQNGYELDELHNVLISNTIASGDFLKYNGTVWVNDPINLGTDTVGNYMVDVSAGTGIAITHTASEGSTATIELADVVTNSQSNSYTLALTDKNKMIEMNVGSANNLTVPADNAVNFPVGTSIDILQVGAGQTTIVAAAGVTVNRATGLKLRAQWSAATVIKRAANTWVAIGDLSA